MEMSFNISVCNVGSGVILPINIRGTPWMAPMNLIYWFDSGVFEGSGWSSFEMLYLPISLYFFILDFRGKQHAFHLSNLCGAYSIE